MTYFIGETADVYKYFELNDKYFASGTSTTTYVDNANVDYSSADVQEQLLVWNEKYEECAGCNEKWNMPNTLS